VKYNLGKFGLETNLINGAVALQGLLVLPSTITIDANSQVRVNGNLVNSSGAVAVNYGLALGLSFFDGIIAIGWGGLFYDKRDFTGITGNPGNVYQSNFVYFNIQPISAIKALIIQVK